MNVLKKFCFKRQLHSDQKDSQDAENVSKNCLDLVRNHYLLGHCIKVASGPKIFFDRFGLPF